MLEAGEVLWTWRLAPEPSLWEAQNAERLADHRLMYLDYEGPVSGGRGYVVRLDDGVFDWVERGESRIEVELIGEKVRGRLVLVQQLGEVWVARLEVGSA